MECLRNRFCAEITAIAEISAGPAGLRARGCQESGKQKLEFAQADEDYF